MWFTADDHVGHVDAAGSGDDACRSRRSYDDAIDVAVAPDGERLVRVGQLRARARAAPAAAR